MTILNTPRESYHYEHDGFLVDILFGISSAREHFEDELTRARVALPLQHRCAWARAHPSTESWFVAVRDAHGTSCCGFALEVGRTRALPGHLVIRSERFGTAPSNEARAAALHALADFARRNRRILRVTLEVFSRDSGTRDVIARLLSSVGFSRTANGRSYEQTVVLDLTPDETSIFASLSSRARRGIRAIHKCPAVVRPIIDERYAERIEALLRETFARSGGRYPKEDWRRRIDLCNQYPSISRLVGFFSTDVGGPEGLLAFAWGRAHGDHAEYADSASTRVATVRAPLSYALAWDLICWARRNGATWFDFGGITRGHLGDGDPLGGISDFKRFFSNQIAPVGEEWVLEPHYLKAKLAQALSAGAAWAGLVTNPNRQVLGTSRRDTGAS